MVEVTDKDWTVPDSSISDTAIRPCRITLPLDITCRAQPHAVTAGHALLIISQDTSLKLTNHKHRLAINSHFRLACQNVLI